MNRMPEDFRLAFIKDIKSWVLDNHPRGLVTLNAWDENYADLTSIRSNSVPGGTAKNLRRLVKLKLEGVLIEKYRWKGSMRSFTLPQPSLDSLGRQSVKELESLGYEIGLTMTYIEPPQ